METRMKVYPWQVFLAGITLFGAFVRFFQLSSFPPAMYVDEALVGYNAYALLQDWRDEYGEFLPIAFRAWGTWAAPLQYYLAMVGTKLFGLTEFGTRFHSAVMGSLTIPLSFFLTRLLTKRTVIALLTACFLALSPWHIHQSRMAVETTTSVFFLTLGIYLFLRWKEGGRTFLLKSAAACFALTFYAYHTGRVTTPLLLLVLSVYAWKSLRRSWQSVIGAAVVGLIVSMPLFIHLVTDYARVTARPRAINVFADKGVELALWEDVTSDGEAPTLITRALHNKLFGYTEDIFRRFLSHFAPSYLFLSGDPHERFQIPETGLLLFIGLILVPIGLSSFIRDTQSQRYRFIIVGWLLLVPVVSSFSFITPNSYHTLEAAVPWMIVLSIGIHTIGRWGTRRFGRRWVVLLVAVFLLNISHYFFQYYVGIPQQLASVWAYGFKEAVGTVRAVGDEYHRVIFSNRVYILLLYYLQYPPEKFRAEFIRAPTLDQWGFEHISAFDRYTFPIEFDWENIEKTPGILYVVESGKIPLYWPDQKTNRLRRVHEIFYPNGEKALELVEIV